MPCCTWMTNPEYKDHGVTVDIMDNTCAVTVMNAGHQLTLMSKQLKLKALATQWDPSNITNSI